MSTSSELLDFDRRLAWDPLPPPMGSSNLAFHLESDLVICETLSLCICDLSSPGFMDGEFPSNKAILEDAILDFQPPP
jgi:hypothetical protein